MRAWMLALVLGVSAVVQAQTADNLMYAINNNSPYEVYTIDQQSGAASAPIGNLSFSSAGLARDPTSGLLYYTAINPYQAGRYRVATFNPATGANTNLSGYVTVYMPRLTFRSDGVLFGMDSNNNLYTISTATGSILTTTAITCSGSCGGWATGLGGDIAFSPTGTLHLVGSATLFTISGSAATRIGPTGTPTLAGLAFGRDGSLYASDTGAATSTIYRLNTGSGTGTAIASSGEWIADLAAMPKFANLSMTKTATGAFVAGTTATYTMTIANTGPQNASGPLTVTDTLPAGVTYSGVSAGWGCSAVGQNVTCSRAAGLNNGTNTSFTLTVTLASNVSATVVNSATVSSTTFDHVPANNTESETTAITFPPDLTISKTHVGNFSQGQVGANYTITVTNSGLGPTTSPITVTDTLPAGLSYVSGSPAPWSCSALGQVVTCIRNSVLNAGANSAITLTVNVSPTAPASVTNTASVATTGELNVGNNSASDPTTINQLADLTITKTHVGNFTRGAQGVYDITVTNSGASATNGTAVTVTDTLPAGLTFFSAVPASWNCGAVGQIITCSRSDVLNAGLSYPAISVTVTVAQSAASSVTNTASVSGGGQVNTANDTANDPTTIVSSSDLSVTKVISTPGTGVGSNVTFTVTLTNSGPSNATNVAVRDQLPAGLFYISSTPSAGAYASGTGVWTIASVASGASPTLQLVARIDVLGSLTNTAQVTASDQPDPDSTPNNNNAAEDDQASVSLSTSPPNVTLCKTIQGQPCPPPAPPSLPPGSDITYLITFTNTGGSYASAFVLIDPIPANTDFKVGSVTTALGSTGLTVVVDYSNNGGTIWTYAPASGAGGAPAGYDRFVTHVRWSFGGNLSHIAPNNTGSVSFITRIR